MADRYSDGYCTWRESIFSNFHWPFLFVEINLVDGSQGLVVNQVPLTDGLDVLNGEGAAESGMA